MQKVVAPLPIPVLQDWVGFQALNTKAGHLLQLLRIQSITKREARQAALSENPIDNETSKDLLTKIHKLQGKDPLYIRLKKKINANTSRKGYTINQKGLLFYKEQ